MIEVNFDGLVGPTHNYAGLSFGNIASDKNQGEVSNPKQAALQGLSKMRKLLGLGLTQGFLPPQERPFFPVFRQLGFSGTNAQILNDVTKRDPQLLAMGCSASSMWTANAATLCPARDNDHGRLSFTPANLVSMGHRRIEAEQTTRTLSKIFADPNHFVVNDPLPSHTLFGDEGAANHNRLCRTHADKGLHIFVYGGQGSCQSDLFSFPRRQTLRASRAVARLNGIAPDQTCFIQQSDVAIEAGAFHNDVVCVVNENVFFYHEHAFDSPDEIEKIIAEKAQKLGIDPIFIRVRDSELPLDKAISTYIFNSQIVTKPDGQMCFILPTEVEESKTARDVIDTILQSANNPIDQAHYLDLRQSMRNGGGPACLRLRVVLDEDMLGKLHAPSILDEEKLVGLEGWVNKHYRDRLHVKDLGDPLFADEMMTALDELTTLCKFGSFYDFQLERIRT